MKERQWWRESRFILWIYSTYFCSFEGELKIWDKSLFFSSVKKLTWGALSRAIACILHVGQPVWELSLHLSSADLLGSHVEKHRLITKMLELSWEEKSQTNLQESFEDLTTKIQCVSMCLAICLQLLKSKDSVLRYRNQMITSVLHKYLPYHPPDPSELEPLWLQPGIKSCGSDHCFCCLCYHPHYYYNHIFSLLTGNMTVIVYLKTHLRTFPLHVWLNKQTLENQECFCCLFPQSPLLENVHIIVT